MILVTFDGRYISALLVRSMLFLKFSTVQSAHMTHYGNEPMQRCYRNAVAVNDEFCCILVNLSLVYNSASYSVSEMSR